ncbi:MAG: tRNA nucleotidyltransferase, partial [Gemmatimonadota bacterium]|nr:tRNA nucleotidyltransferase [Gemmatimonadota bacterium]
GVLARDGTMYDVTTFRKDVATDGRHAVVAFSDTLAEDLARRDFTINAIAWHPMSGEFVDPFGGRTDLEEGVLRTVGEPGDRFREDYLRILRALRFAGRFSLKVEQETWRALGAGVDHLGSLSAERVREELLKVLEADAKPSVALGLYAASGALRVLYPELSALDPDEWTRTLDVVDALPRGRPLLRLAALLRPLSREGVVALLVRLRLSNVQTDRVALWASSAPRPAAREGAAAVRGWTRTVGRENVAALSRIEMAESRVRGSRGDTEAVAAMIDKWRFTRSVLSEDPPLTVGSLAFSGRDLVAMGERPGPHFGRVLERLLDWVVEDPARNRGELLAARAVEVLEVERRRDD